MKNLITFGLVISLNLSSAFAGVREDVLRLGDLAMGVTEHKVAGKNAEKIFKNYLEKEYGEDTDLVFKEIDDMAYGDEVDEGFTSTKSAIAMRGFAESYLTDLIDGLDSDENRQQIQEAKAKVYDLNRNWAPIIKRLEKSGAKFGYTGNGPGYCGVSFVELIIIDEKEQKLYEVYLSESGSC